MTKNEDVAVWMMEKWKEKGHLYQDDAVMGIEKEFGYDFVIDT